MPGGGKYSISCMCADETSEGLQRRAGDFGHGGWPITRLFFFISTRVPVSVVLHSHNLINQCLHVSDPHDRGYLIRPWETE